MRPSFSSPVQAERSKISSSQTKFQKSIDKGICLCYNIICLENRIAELCKGSTADYAYRACGILPCEEIKVSLSLQRNAHQGAHPERQTLFFFLFSPMLLSVGFFILNIAELCKGSTADSDSVCLGSNPSSAAIEKQTII